MTTVLKIACPFAIKIAVYLGICRIIQTVVFSARERVVRTERGTKAVTQISESAANFQNKPMIKRVAVRADTRGFLDSLVRSEFCNGGESDTNRRARRVVVLSFDGNRRCSC